MKLKFEAFVELNLQLVTILKTFQSPDMVWLSIVGH
jgi:hypothetical protein